MKAKRSAWIGLISAAAIGAALFVPGAAMANVTNPPSGSQPGALTLSPSSGASTLTPTWSTSSACPAGFQTNATLSVMADDGTEQQISVPVIGALVGAPFNGTLEASMGDILSVAGPAGETYEFVVDCHATAGLRGELVQSTFVTYSADGSSWTSSGTAPTGPTGPVATTTSLSANPTTALQGASVALTATVTGAGAAGNVEFFSGADSLGTSPVASGKATMSVSSLAVGVDPITAKFEPTDSTAFSGSTSSAVNVTIVASNGDNGTETINVNVPLSEGVFTMTVSPNAVQLTDAVNNGTKFESTGALSPVTVSDGRQQSKPGWSISGQVSDFTSGSNTIDGNDLGWAPAITTPNSANDVTAGAAITAGSNPGLKQGGALAKAAAGAGIGTTVLGANFDLQFPVDTQPGAYGATLTVTAIESAS
jgi:hypothetical protein